MPPGHPPLLPQDAATLKHTAWPWWLSCLGGTGSSRKPWMVCTACSGTCCTYWAAAQSTLSPGISYMWEADFLSLTFSTGPSSCYRLFQVLYYSWDLTSCNLLPGTKPPCCWAAKDLLICVFSLEQPQNSCQARSCSKSTSGSLPHLPGNLIILASCHKGTDWYQF